MPSPKQDAGAYYPISLNLRGRKCVVVGGGRVAERKVLNLIKAGADMLKVISPELTPRLEREKAKGSFIHAARRFKKTDLKGAFLTIAATDDPKTNGKIGQSAAGLVNVVDQPALCSFIVPATLRRGPLCIAVSTSGTSPAMARAIRKDMEGIYGTAFSRYLNGLRAMRARAMNDMPDTQERERYLKSLASQETIKALREGRTPKAAAAGKGKKRTRG